METGFHVDTRFFEFGIRLRIGTGPLGLFSSLRSCWRWLRATVAVRLGFEPPPAPYIAHARVQSLDEGFAAFRELRGAPPPPARRGAPRPPRPSRPKLPPPTSPPQDFERYRTSRHAPARATGRRRRTHRPSGSGEHMFGVTAVESEAIRGRTREWRKQVEGDDAHVAEAQHSA